MKYLHTMIRISNIEKLLNFFCKGLGLKETKRKENEKGRYTLVTWLASEENSFSTSAVFDLSGGRATY